jgi:hypothetical protein
MTARVLAGGDAEHFAVDDCRAEQHDDPVHGPHELRVAGAPAHALRDRQRVERRFDDPGNSAGVGSPFFRADEHQHASLRTVDLLQLIDADSARRRESSRCLGRLTASSNAFATAGPCRLISWSGCCSAKPCTRTASRRGVANHSTSPCAIAAGQTFLRCRRPARAPA